MATDERARAAGGGGGGGRHAAGQTLMELWQATLHGHILTGWLRSHAPHCPTSTALPLPSAKVACVRVGAKPVGRDVVGVGNQERCFAFA